MILRILLVDDNALIRDALRLTLASEPQLLVVAEAGDGADVEALVRQHQPDVVCMDLNMHRMGGEQATRLLRASHPGVKVLGLSAHTDADRIRDMLLAGACGYVLKSVAGSELVPAILAVAMGEVYVSPGLHFQLPGRS